MIRIHNLREESLSVAIPALLLQSNTPHLADHRFLLSLETCRATLSGKRMLLQYWGNALPVMMSLMSLKHHSHQFLTGHQLHQHRCSQLKVLWQIWASVRGWIVSDTSYCVKYGVKGTEVVTQECYLSFCLLKFLQSHSFDLICIISYSSLISSVSYHASLLWK